MRTATIQLESTAPYSQSQKINTLQREKKESWDDFERRVWRDKAHYSPDGHVYIPQFAFKQAIDGAAKYLGKIEGKGNATWSKRFVGGVIVSESITLPEKRDDLTEVWILAHANGKRGPGTRVPRCFPVILKWSGQLKCLVVDEEIREDVFARAIELSGLVVGIGRFRPENGGENGRYTVKSIKWN